MCTRRLKIKKLVTLAALIIFASSLFTCDIFSPNEDSPQAVDRSQNTNTDTESYTVTVYLDGSPPVLYSSRSLTKELAVFGHDYFEVTFVRPQTGGQIIARASWERGHAAGVSGVARGVDYQYTSVGAVPANSDGGAALLFVGKRSDRTLLGVGRLTGTDDGGPTSTFISLNTKSVTFTVTALKAGAHSDPNQSSFLIGGSREGYTNPSVLNTEPDVNLIEVFIGDRLFPLYRLDLNQTTYAQYTIECFTGFETGILTADTPGSPPRPPGTLAQTSGNYHLTPRYPRGNGTWETPPLDLPSPDNSFKFDNNTVVTWRNNLAAGVLQNPLQFSFNTATTVNSSIFAFAFEIPVYPLTNNDSRASFGDFNDGDLLWYIRPGYDNYLYDLDDGRGGTGGALLIGSGVIDQSLLYHLSVTPPLKRGYFNHPTNPNLNADWGFDLTGIVISLKAGNLIVRNILPTDPNLTFILGARRPSGLIVISTSPPSPPPTVNITDLYDIYNDPSYQAFRDQYIHNDTLVVYVEYYDSISGNTYADQYPIYFFDPSSGGLPDSSEIPFNNRIVASSWLDLNRLNGIAPGRYMVLFYDNMDIPQINIAGGVTLIFLAARPNLTIGKVNNGGITSNAAGNVFYFGVWPYNEIITIGGNQVVSQPFQFNPAGSWVNYATGTPDYGIGSPNYAPPNGSTAGTSQFFLSRSYNTQTYTVSTGAVMMPNPYMEQFFSMPDGVPGWGPWDGNTWQGAPWVP
jgi:hypothetical protein